MPDTPTKTLDHSETRDFLQGAKQSAETMVTECRFTPAAGLDGLAANLATFLEWSRLQDSDGVGFFLTSNCAVYTDNIAPTVCCTNHDAVRYARHELKQLKLRGFSGLLEFIADDDQSPTADDFAQAEATHKSVNEKQAAIVAETVVSQRVIKRIDILVAEALLKSFFADDPLRAIYREKAAKISGAGGMSVALLAAIRSTITGVRPKLQKLVLETVGVKPFLAAGFGMKSGRVHSEFRLRYLRLARANGWLEDERLNSTQLTALLRKFLSELTSESFRSDVDTALNAIVCARRSVVIQNMDETEVLEGVGNADGDVDTADSECRSLLSAIVEVCRRYDRDGATLCASARGAGHVARAAAAAGVNHGTDRADDGDEDPRVARIVELLTASLAPAPQRRAPRGPGGADTTGDAPPTRRAARDCSVCLLKGKGALQHFFDQCPELKGLDPEAITALKKEARAAGHDSWWNELQAKKGAAEAGRRGKGTGGRARSRGGGRGGQRADPPKSTALALSDTKELTDTIRGLLALTPPPSPPSGDMDELDDVGGPGGARVERGRGSIHNGIADQSLTSPDMSIAELLFSSTGRLLRRLAVWCAVLPWRAVCVAACVAQAPGRAARWLYDRFCAAPPRPLVDRKGELADRLTKLLSPETFSELRGKILADDTAALHAAGACGGDVPVLLRPADIEEAVASSSRLSASASAFIPLVVEDSSRVVGGLAPCATQGAAFQAAFPAAWFDDLCTADLAELLRLTVAREHGRIPLTCSLLPVDWAAAVDRRCQVDIAYAAARADGVEHAHVWPCVRQRWMAASSVDPRPYETVYEYIDDWVIFHSDGSYTLIPRHGGGADGVHEGGRRDRGRGSVHNGRFDQSASAPDMSIADLPLVSIPVGDSPDYGPFSPGWTPDDLDADGYVKIWSPNGLAKRSEPRPFFTDVPWAGQPPRPPIPASNRPHQQRTLAFAGHPELTDFDPWYYREDHGRAEFLRYWLPAGGGLPDVFERLLGDDPEDIPELIAPPLRWLELMAEHDGGLYFHVDKIGDGIVACWRNGFDGSTHGYGHHGRTVELRHRRHLHLLAAVSCEATSVTMMRDVVLHYEDEDVRRFPWDGSPVGPFYVGHATCDEVDPTARALPLLPGPRGLSAGRLLHAEGGIYDPYPATTATVSAPPSGEYAADVRHIASPVFLEGSAAQAPLAHLRARAHLLRCTVATNESALPRTQECGREPTVLAGFAVGGGCSCVHTFGVAGITEAAATIGVCAIDVDVIAGIALDAVRGYQEVPNDDPRVRALFAFGFLPRNGGVGATACAYCGATRRPPLPPNLSPIACLAREGLAVGFARFLFQFNADRSDIKLRKNAGRVMATNDLLRDGATIGARLDPKQVVQPRPDGCFSFGALSDADVQHFLAASRMRPLGAFWVTRVVAASLLHAGGADDLDPIVVEKDGDSVTVRMRFTLVGLDAVPGSAVWKGAPLETYATGSNGDVASGSRLDGDAVALVAWLHLRCLVTFALAGIYCGFDTLSFIAPIGRASLLYRSRIFAIPAERRFDDSSLVFGAVARIVARGIDSLPGDERARMLREAENLSRDHGLRANVENLGTCSSMYGDHDVANASFLRAERTAMKNISLLAEREVSSAEVDISRWLLTRALDPGHLVVALVDLIQATTLVPALEVLAPAFIRGSGLEATYGIVATTAVADDVRETAHAAYPDASVAGIARAYFSQGMPPAVTRFLFAFAASARVLSIFLANAGVAPCEGGPSSSRDVDDELDDFPRKDDGRFARDEDASVASEIFGPDTHGHLDRWGQAMVAWYVRSSGKECKVNGLAQMLNAAMFIGYSGRGDEGRAELVRNAQVIVYLLAKVARKHVLIAPVVAARALADSPLPPNGQGEAPPDTRWEHSGWIGDQEHDRRLSRDAIRLPYGAGGPVAACDVLEVYPRNVLLSNGDVAGAYTTRCEFEVALHNAARSDDHPEVTVPPFPNPEEDFPAPADVDDLPAAPVHPTADGA